MDQRRTFRIIETLGKGGFGTVYRAEMADAGGFAKQVALKVMHYRGEAAADIARRMRDEARVLGLIRHRAIVGVSGLVPLVEGWGVVMDFIDGVDVSTAIRGGAPPIAVSLQVVEEVAAALDAAWTQPAGESGQPLRLIHRDIKPSNIRVTATGEVKLLDFGVARAEFESRESGPGEEVVMGSSRYLAPERRQGQDQHKSDVYALGIVLANLLTGQRFPEPPDTHTAHDAFVGTVLDTVHTAFAGSPDPGVQDAARNLRLLLLEMLAFHPDDRPDGRAVAVRLRRFAAGLPRPHLRDWAETNVPRLLPQQARKVTQDADSGRVLREASASGTYLEPGEPTLDPAASTDEDSSTSSLTGPRPAVPGAAPTLAPATWKILLLAGLFAALGAAVVLALQVLS